ncbi:MAG: aldehyde dehydrogenase family protein [Armatimonadetes bacterium]|nr:aldehyde dehydrogenase family protein [Armatimonadota bacterium]
MGPLNNEPTAAKNDRHIADAEEKGALVLTGGGRDSGRPTRLFYQPTVLDGCTTEMALNHEESFGPLAPVIGVKDDEEALRVANDCTLGLVSAVFTRDLNRAFRFAEGLKTGIVVVNDHTDYWELHIPFGGSSGKRSGIGRLGGKASLMEMTEVKTICIEIGG